MHNASCYLYLKYRLLLLNKMLLDPTQVTTLAKRCCQYKTVVAKSLKCFSNNYIRESVKKSKTPAKTVYIYRISVPVSTLVLKRSLCSNPLPNVFGPKDPSPRERSFFKTHQSTIGTQRRHTTAHKRERNGRLHPRRVHPEAPPGQASRSQTRKYKISFT